MVTSFSGGRFSYGTSAPPMTRNRQRVSLDELALMPVWIDRRRFAGRIELRDLFLSQLPSGRAEVLSQLRLVAGTDDHACHRGALQQPVQGDLRHSLARFLGYFIQSVNNLVEQLLGNRRSLLCSVVESAVGGELLVARDLPGATPPPQRAPDDRPNLLVERERHKFPFVLAPNEGVVCLMGYIARPAVCFRDGKRLHQVPAGEIGTGDVTDLASLNKIIERPQRLLDRTQRVEPVEGADVDGARVQPTPAGI